MQTAAKWLIWTGCVLSVLGACAHLYGYTFTDQNFGGSNVRPDVIAAYRALFLMFAVPPFCLAPIFLLAMRMRGGKKIMLLGMLVPLASVVLLFHFLGIFVGTIIMTIATTPLAIGILLWRDEAV
jgi:hypothetical protein